MHFNVFVWAKRYENLPDHLCLHSNGGGVLPILIPQLFVPHPPSFSVQLLVWQLAEFFPQVLLMHVMPIVAPPFTRERAEAERMLSSRIAEIIRFFIVMIFVWLID